MSAERMVFRTHGPSGIEHVRISRAWSEYAQTLNLTATTKQQREALRDAFYAGAIARFAKTSAEEQLQESAQ